MGKSKGSTKSSRKKQTKPAVIADICPSCDKGGDVINGKCRLCGARKTINSVSGNVIWMRNGRVVRAFEDSRRAYVAMAVQHGIPEDRWPEEFRTLRS